MYATEIVRERQFPGSERALNAHSGEGRADFLVSLDQMREDLPLVEAAALTVGWFGDDVRAGQCRIRPGVETRESRTQPIEWSVDGQARGGAYLISKNAAGGANYGGTPTDASVLQAIAELKRRGLAVTLTPFLMMDVTAGNGLSDPYGGAEQAAFPWRGRITVNADGTAAARDAVEAFMDGRWGYRNFILHHARLAAEAGGVEAFLIGSEMRGLTRIRDGAGTFPFIEALRALAGDVRAILPDANLSYAADWTEYGAYVDGDDVMWPLDDLWADDAIDFIGIDWYPPMGDWRDGNGHLDASAGYDAPDSGDYLAAQLEGGEAYDWYYASDADRAAQVRTPISDGAYGEPWVYRAKDLKRWMTQPHYTRTDGVQAAAPTLFQPGAKPVRLSEIGFAAVDKGGNAPNVFYDPKSSESALPPYSSGDRDDVYQARALAASLSHFEAMEGVEAALVWAWDGRPFPAWPLRSDIWGDGDNWSRGHWLNGRSGAAPLADTVAEICASGGVEADTSDLVGLVEGYVLDGVHSVRSALEPLVAAFGIEVIERGGRVIFRMKGTAPVWQVSSAALVEGGLTVTHGLLDKAPKRLRLTYVDASADYQPAIAEARINGGDPRLSVDSVLALSMAAGRADRVAAALLDDAAERDTATIGLALMGRDLQAGDGIRIDDGPVWRISDIRDEGILRTLSLEQDRAPLAARRAGAAPTVPTPARVMSAPDLVVMDAPALPGEGTGQTGPLIAAFADPWTGPMIVRAGVSADQMTERAIVQRPSLIARLLAPCGAGPIGRWDRAAKLRVSCPGGDLANLAPGAVLNGGNGAMLETQAGWELIQYERAELVAPDTYELTSLLRGQQGSVSAAAEPGARLVMLNGETVRAAIGPEEIGTQLIWQPSFGETQQLTFNDLAGLSWSPAHVRADKVEDGSDGGWRMSWVRRGADVAASWALPDGENTGRFAVEVDRGAGFGSRIDVLKTAAVVPSDAAIARVAELGADGRAGRWVSILLGTA